MTGGARLYPPGAGSIRTMKKQLLLSFMLLIAHCGCGAYRPAPLTEASVRTALAPPDMAAVRLDASRLHHPRLAPLEFDDRDGLSPDEAAVLAVLNNPRLRALRSQRRIARAQLFQAGILPNPQLAYNLDVPFGGNTAGLVNAFGLGLSWDVTSLLARGANVDSAAARRAAVELDVAWQEWQVAQAARQGVVRLASAQARLVLAGEIEHDLDERRQVLDRAAAQGNTTRIEISAAEAAWRSASIIRLGIEQEAARERLSLLETLGLGANAAVLFETSFYVPSSSAIGDWSHSQITADLEQQRLDLLALRLGYQSQDAALRAAIRSQFPRINLGFARARDTSNINTAGFGVTVDLPFFDRNQGRIALEAATRRQLFDDYTARVAQARIEVAQALAGLESTRRQAAATEAAIPGLEKLVAAYEEGIQQGNADVLSYYDARASLANRRLELLNLQRDLANLFVAMEIASGSTLRRDIKP